MLIYKIEVCYADQKSKMATNAGNRLTFDPMGKCSNVFFSETTNMIKAKLYMNVHWMVLNKLNLVKDIPMIIHLQFGFSQFISFREEDL
jgi:hypothetical protein